MICPELFDAMGFQCQQLTQGSAPPVYHLSTPFQTFDGDGIGLFAETDEDTIRIFDAGRTIFHIIGSAGIDLSDGRSMQPIKKLVDAAGAVLSDDGEIFMVSMRKDAEDCARRVLSAILAVSSWERDNVGIPSDGVRLASEVEFLLRQWKPSAPIESGRKGVGISGREYEFDLYQDGFLIDAVSSHPQATASVIRKLADVRGVPSQQDLKLLIIIDDRQDAIRATQEASIIRQFAPTKTVSWLQSQVRQPTAIN